MRVFTKRRAVAAAAVAAVLGVSAEGKSLEALAEAGGGARRSAAPG